MFNETSLLQLQIITRLLQMNCNNEISLNIIYLLYLDNSYVYTVVFFSSFVYNVNLWPEDGQARLKHIVTIAAINTKPRQLFLTDPISYFWYTVQNLMMDAPDSCGSATPSSPPKKLWAPEIQKAKKIT
jgi:hypothetical protein